MGEEFFSCNMCGECCTNLGLDRAVYLNSEDCKKVSNYLSIKQEKFIEQYCTVEIIATVQGKVKLYRFVPNTKGQCNFLAQDNKCSLQDAKPHQCQAMPMKFFWNGTSNYPCVKLEKVPDGWSSEASDKHFLAGIERN